MTLPTVGTVWRAKHRPSLRVQILLPSVEMRISASVKACGVLYLRMDQDEAPTCRRLGEFLALFNEENPTDPGTGNRG